jgi:hypothetical protein
VVNGGDPELPPGKVEQAHWHSLGRRRRLGFREVAASPS